MPDIICAGPGPHEPVSGVLGTSDKPVAGILCPPCGVKAANAAYEALAPQRARDLNAATIRAAATLALDANRTYLAIASPTSTQATAQIRALTRQNQGVIRLLLGLLDATD